MITKVTAFLSQILPYETAAKKNGEIRTGLKEYQALLRASLAAIKAFQELNLEQFDSLVGENACQIRTVWIATLASNTGDNLNKLNDQISLSLNKINALLEPKKIDSLMCNEKNLKMIFEEENLDISLTSTEMFLIQCYLLSEMKTVKLDNQKLISIFIVDIADPKKFKRFGDVSTSFADNLLSRLRKMLAISSVEFVRNHAHGILRKMVASAFIFEKNTLPCLPMFWTYKTVLKVAESANIPFILHAKFLTKESDGFKVIDEAFLFFKNTKNGPYEHMLPSTFDLNRPACVVQGIVVENAEGYLLRKDQWLEKIKEKGLFNVILAAAADHRQYPDHSLDIIFTALGDKEYESYKTLAKSAGFSSDNPTTFFIQHVYPSRVGKTLEAIFPRTQTQQAVKNKDLFYKLQEIPIYAYARK